MKADENQEPSVELQWDMMRSKGFDVVIEKSKSSKSKGVWPGFKVYKGFVVVLWWGCGVIRGEKLVICDIDSLLRWYMIKSLLFKCFLK